VTDNTSTVFAFGIGISRTSGRGEIIDCYFPAPIMRPEAAVAALIGAHFAAGTGDATPDQVAAFARALGDGASTLADVCMHLAEADRPLTVVLAENDGPIASTAEAFLTLHLLSHRLALPNPLNLDDLFTHLPNVAWTNRGAVHPRELPGVLLAARLAGEHVEVSGIDKFPRMTNYVVPSGVRIADASRIRLGAYLGEGTTVMHEGFVNFNAGALGPNMLEGRVSQGVVVGANSDLGGGSSTMGTLSGGGEIKLTIGTNCLIGANGGTGIPLGDRCSIEAGLYITAGTRVTVLDENQDEVRVVKARELAGGNDLLFIRHSVTGQIQCRTNRRAIELNDALHAHN
jgi:2,3,4,5-tetrahydropyridine-2-carboxylate N-succinyltransferase